MVKANVPLQRPRQETQQPHERQSYEQTATTLQPTEPPNTNVRFGRPTGINDQNRNEEDLAENFGLPTTARQDPAPEDNPNDPNPAQNTAGMAFQTIYK